MKTITSGAVIGNLLYAAVLYNISAIPKGLIFKFVGLISDKLERKDYYVSISEEDIREFVEAYPFIATLSEDSLHLNDTDTAMLQRRLKRYFRIGLPAYVIEVMDMFSEVVFA